MLLVEADKKVLGANTDMQEAAYDLRPTFAAKARRLVHLHWLKIVMWTTTQAILVAFLVVLVRNSYVMSSNPPIVHYTA